MSALRKTLAVTLLLTFSALISPVAAQEQGIQATINAQIEAFKLDDFETAFTHASPNIQTMFGNPERFGVMVRQGYPMVWRPGALDYLELRELSGQLWQKVMIEDSRGTAHILDYRMVQIDGVWRIAGVRILEAPGVGV
ncbi:MAG: DUF4864 domain-containing protein [Pseudomonadota bacterium]